MGTHLDLLVVLGERDLISLAVEGVGGDGRDAAERVGGLPRGHGNTVREVGDEEGRDSRTLVSLREREGQEWKVGVAGVGGGGGLAVNPAVEISIGKKGRLKWQAKSRKRKEIRRGNFIEAYQDKAMNKSLINKAFSSIHPFKIFDDPSVPIFGDFYCCPSGYFQVDRLT